MSRPWPPPPDLHSIQELLRAADPEAFLEEGAPADEYELEERAVFEQIKNFSTAELVPAKTLPILETVWQEAFQLDESGLAERRPSLLGLAQQIERFFGPEAKPQVRAS